jgi:DUF1365 family protein
MVLLDIDRIAEQMAVSRLTGHNQRRWASFDDRDHLGDPSLPLRTRLAADAARAGVALPDGPVFLLTHLRYLGYCFNPISIFYAFDRGGALRQVMAEVHNTFGGAHTYWLTADEDGGGAHTSAAKALRVSPFLPMDMDYRFAITPPVDRPVVHIEAGRGGATVLDATLTLERRPWTAAEIRRCLLRQPAMTARVTAAIHWQALRLWWKGVPVIPGAAATGREAC